MRLLNKKTPTKKYTNMLQTIHNVQTAKPVHSQKEKQFI